MAHKYPQRAPQSVVSGSNHLLSSLRRWPGMPSFQDKTFQDTSSTGGLEQPTCVRMGAHTSWVPDLEIDIDLDGMHQDWSHASEAGCIAPYPPHKTPQAHARTVRAPVAGGTEMVYGQMVHELPSLVVALLKILLAAGVTASPVALFSLACTSLSYLSLLPRDTSDVCCSCVCRAYVHICV